MQLPQSVNARLSRIASVAQGARSEGWQKLLPWAVSALLVVVLAWQLVQLAWTLLGARAQGPRVTAPTTAGQAARPAVDVGAIVAAHLFGEANAPAGSADPSEVAATQMALVLVGTIAHSDPELGYAIIGPSAQSAKVYGVGKTITGGTKLHSVYPDRAIIDRGGKLEALLLPKKFTGGGMAAGPRPGFAGQSDPMLGERLRQLAASNPGAITEILRPQPVFANGQQRGYRVYPGRNRQQFNKLGLLPGDMVTAINGTPLDDPARGMEVLSTMNSAANVTVTVERNGETVQVNINNAQIAADAAALEAMPDAVPVEEVPAMTGGDDSEE
ncbi:MAG TPA: type II secretion system protein GspC [Steroidobacteraceae bacterium]|nr:type II secretion system protein GspC [Steroidobacteraceae bacterium]